MSVQLTTFRSHLKHWTIPTTISLFLLTLGVLTASVMLTGHRPPLVSQIVPGFEPFQLYWFIVALTFHVSLWLPDAKQKTMVFLRKLMGWTALWFVWAIINYSLFVICVVKLHWLITVL